MSGCPFCGRDPYHYVDNGVGMEAVAVTCCELGIELFDHREPRETIEISWESFMDAAEKLRAKRDEISRLDALIETATEALRPLAALYDLIDDRDADPDSDKFFQHDGTIITFGDIRRARGTLKHAATTNTGAKDS